MGASRDPWLAIRGFLLERFALQASSPRAPLLPPPRAKGLQNPRWQRPQTASGGPALNRNALSFQSVNVFRASIRGPVARVERLPHTAIESVVTQRGSAVDFDEQRTHNFFSNRSRASALAKIGGGQK